MIYELQVYQAGMWHKWDDAFNMVCLLDITRRESSMIFKYKLAWRIIRTGCKVALAYNRVALGIEAQENA